MKEQRTNRTLYKDDKWKVLLYSKQGVVKGEYNDSFIVPPDCEITIEHEKELETQLKKATDRALKHLCERYITEVDFNLLSTSKNRQSDNLFFTLRFYCPLGKNDVVDLCISARDAVLEVIEREGFKQK